MAIEKTNKWAGFSRPTNSIPVDHGKEKLRELVCYISEKCSTDRTFGKTKLNKILYFSDFIHFAYYGTPITGTPYVRLPHGPVPRGIDRILKKMDGKAIEIHNPEFYGYEQHRIVPSRTANIDSYFKPSQISLVDGVIKALWGKTASQVSKMSHTRAWRIAKKGGVIPYEAIFISDEDVTDYDISRARELSRTYGWSVV